MEERSFWVDDTVIYSLLKAQSFDILNNYQNSNNV